MFLVQCQSLIDFEGQNLTLKQAWDSGSFLNPYEMTYITQRSRPLLNDMQSISHLFCYIYQTSLNLRL